MASENEQTENKQTAKLFTDLESALIREGSKRMRHDDIVGALDRRRAGIKERSDEEYYKWLVMIVFYSGMRAEIVSAKESTILQHFPTYQCVLTYGDTDIRRMMNDPGMIEHERKIQACVYNAREFERIVSQHGSFQKWLDSYDAADGGTNLARLVTDFGTTFHWYKPTTTNHFLTHFGYPTLKPDRVIRRILWRLGLLDNEGNEAEAIEVGRDMARVVGVPVPYLDYVLVCYGQESHHAVGLERGICLTKAPRCDVCGVTYSCRYFANRT
jgi:DNA-3-methyladenine glycosylase I